MSYLIENSKVISKKEYEENTDKYMVYKKYEIDDYYILTINEKAFFSIYDIANFCKNKYKESKLFLIAHKYFDNIKEETLIEFYIFNTVNIFEKSLTSLITIANKDLISKQRMLFDNITIAKKLLNINDIHIILGDNVKEHEISEYLNYSDTYNEIIFFDQFNDENYISKEINLKIDSQTKKENNVTRISKIINKVRVLEPQSSKIKKYSIILILLIFVILNAQDYSDNFFSDYKNKLKSETRSLKNELRLSKKNLNFKLKQKNSLQNNLDNIKTKAIYKEII